MDWVTIMVEISEVGLNNQYKNHRNWKAVRNKRTEAGRQERIKERREKRTRKGKQEGRKERKTSRIE